MHHLPPHYVFKAKKNGAHRAAFAARRDTVVHEFALRSDVAPNDKRIMQKLCQSQKKVGPFIYKDASGLAS
jgi:hypothetical protein